MKYSAVLSVLGGIAVLIPNIYLSIKLRNQKQIITENIILGVPERLQFRISVGVNANMSWVFASYAIYIWFSYLLFRYGHHVTQDEFKSWHQATKKAFGRYFYLGLISAFGGNCFAFGFVFFIPLSTLS